MNDAVKSNFAVKEWPWYDIMANTGQGENSPATGWELPKGRARLATAAKVTNGLGSAGRETGGTGIPDVIKGRLQGQPRKERRDEKSLDESMFEGFMTPLPNGGFTSSDEENYYMSLEASAIMEPAQIGGSCVPAPTATKEDNGNPVLSTTGAAGRKEEEHP